MSLSIGFTSHLLLAANSHAVSRAGKYERPHYFGDTNSYSVLVDFKSLCIFRVWFMVVLSALIIFSCTSKWWGTVSDCWGMCPSVFQLGYATDQLYRHWLNLPLKSGGEFLPCKNLCVPPSLECVHLRFIISCHKQASKHTHKFWSGNSQWHLRFWSCKNNVHTHGFSSSFECEA